MFEPLVRHLSIPVLLSFPALLRYAVTAPALLGVPVLSLAAWWLQRRPGQSYLVAVEPIEEAYDLEEGLTRAALALRAVVEVGIVERIVALVVRAVVSGARVAHHVVEHDGVEGILRHTVRIVSRTLQRWHTGRLRRNVLWVPIVLALAVLALVLYGW